MKSTFKTIEKKGLHEVKGGSIGTSFIVGAYRNKLSDQETITLIRLDNTQTSP